MAEPSLPSIADIIAALEVAVNSLDAHEGRGGPELSVFESVLNNLRSIEEGSPGGSIAKRIQEQRGELFGAMAVVAVTRDSIAMDDDCDRHIVLRDTYERLNRIASDLCDIADDAAGGVS